MLSDKTVSQDVPQWARTTVFLVGNLGFPAAVALWLLVKIAPMLDQMIRLLEKMLWILERGGGA